MPLAISPLNFLEPAERFILDIVFEHSIFRREYGISLKDVWTAGLLFAV